MQQRFKAGDLVRTRPRRPGAARTLLAGAGVLAALTAVGCGSTAQPQGSSANTVVRTSVVVVTSTKAPAKTTATQPVVGGADGSVRSIMPDVMCMNLQDAQDKIQDAGVFYSRSKDATGRGRAQVLDRNWVVVGQTPAAGSPFGEGDAVLAVVKIGESSPC